MMHDYACGPLSRSVGVKSKGIDRSRENLMRNAIVGAILALPLMIAAQSASAFDCGNRFAAADAAVAEANAAEGYARAATVLAAK